MAVPGIEIRVTTTTETSAVDLDALFGLLSLRKVN